MAPCGRRPPGLTRGGYGLSEAGYRGLGEAELQSALDRLAEADILFVEGDGPQANYRFKHALIQDAAYESLLKSRRRALHHRAAEILRDQPERAAAGSACPSFHQAGLDDLAIGMVGQGGRPGFAPLGLPGGDRPSRQGDRHGGQGGRDVAACARPHGRCKSAAAAIARRLWQRAHSRARPWGAGTLPRLSRRALKSASLGTRMRRGGSRQITAYGSAASCGAISLRCERTRRGFPQAGVAARPDPPEAGVAHRVVGTTHCFAGIRGSARPSERALSLFQPGRDDDLAFRFGQDAGVAAMVFLAIASWPLGNVRRAISLVEDAHERIASVAHVQTHAYAKYHAAWFELMRGDRARAAQNASGDRPSRA